MKKFIIQAIFLIILIFGGLYIATAKVTPDLPFLPLKYEVKTIKINQTSLRVEIADTKSKRSAGLGGRNSIASDSGMLFIFPKLNKYPFWMKNTKISLDIIWIKQKTVVDIIKNATPPLPGQKDETLPVYISNGPVDMVLEVASGFVDTNNIKIDDKIEIQ